MYTRILDSGQGGDLGSTSWRGLSKICSLAWEASGLVDGVEVTDSSRAEKEKWKYNHVVFIGIGDMSRRGNRINWKRAWMLSSSTVS
jgi:hypothetical protein